VYCQKKKHQTNKQKQQQQNKQTLIIVGGQVLYGFSAALSPLCRTDERGSGTCLPGMAVTGVLPEGGLRCAWTPSPDEWLKRPAQGCGTNSALRNISTNGDVVCQPDQNTVATAADFQARGNATCAENEAVQTINADGSVLCYKAPPVDPQQFQAIMNVPCPAGSAVRLVTATSNVTCQTDNVRPELGKALYIHFGGKTCPSEYATEVYTGWCVSLACCFLK
jgi:hypothetical protein